MFESMSAEQNGATHSYDMTQFMPADSEQLQRVYEVSYDGNVPKAEYNHGHCDHLRGIQNN
jgi:hypothetical protein